MLYVHVNEQNKPWIDKVSTQPLDGYDAKNGLLDYQILALVNFPDKCWVDDNGAVVTPQDLPLSEAEQNAQKAQETINQLTGQVTTLSQSNSNLQKQLSNLILSIAKGGTK